MGHSTEQFSVTRQERRGRGAITMLAVGHGVFGGEGVAMIAINKELRRCEIEELLPWHATGTLSRRDADRVEQALAGDRELARQYDLVRQELADTIHLNETLGAPSPRAVEKLFAAIDAEVANAPRPRRRHTNRLSTRPSSISVGSSESARERSPSIGE
jgi:hypothetical protein